jgi:hypothetical protein
MLCHFRSRREKNWTWKRMYIRSPVRPLPGMDARRPIVFGFFAVSQMFTVAHRWRD